MSTMEPSGLADRFEEEELLRIVRDLVRIRTENPPGGEEAAALYIQRILKKEGIEARLQSVAPGRANVTAVLEGIRPGPTLLYNGHLDVVPAGNAWTKEPFEALIQNGRLYGRGASDMKSGVSAMLYAAILLKRMGCPFDGKLILFFNADEEVSNKGMLRMMEDPLKADFAVVSEPSDLDICVCHKGDARIRVTTTGTAGHTAVVQNPDNAITKMIRLVQSLERLGSRIRERKHELLGTASLTVAQFNGGSAPNMVPSRAVIEVDRRIVPGENREDVLGEIESALSDSANQEDFDYESELYLYLPPHDIPVQHRLTQTALRIASETTGKEKRAKPFAATAECPFFSQRLGIPTLILGPGSLLEAHTADESVEVSEIADATKIFVRLALELLRSEEGIA
ncbi:M20 family metallopeptidase [Cohnella thailandensis]|uniref:M20 family metallopeptidase n=1 Tax=Cohnella thailandensis TaxID=557557 RepID=A0A841SXK2_9BACL|nr:M20 family metallopeptidase [Cohnella thailandensis]MBB6635649.1 M20 family metallopeptidase [Cohnella thailandensis]MBP1976025.1 acetylornithine deacetylase/succinyl-diaminopimelate desuccinylase family protein [Cohnella thailandensis]